MDAPRGVLQALGMVRNSSSEEATAQRAVAVSGNMPEDELSNDNSLAFPAGDNAILRAVRSPSVEPPQGTKRGADVTTVDDDTEDEAGAQAPRVLHLL